MILENFFSSSFSILFLSQSVAVENRIEKLDNPVTCRSRGYVAVLVISEFKWVAEKAVEWRGFSRRQTVQSTYHLDTCNNLESSSLFPPPLFFFVFRLSPSFFLSIFVLFFFKGKYRREESSSNIAWILFCNL